MDMSLTNKLFRGGENGKQDREAFMAFPWAPAGLHFHLLAFKSEWIPTDLLETYRETNAKKYTKTPTVTFCRESLIWIFQILFLFSTVSAMTPYYFYI